MLRDVSAPLPVAWDGWPVRWTRWAAPMLMFVCRQLGKDPRCECGSTAPPFTASGVQARPRGDFGVRYGLRAMRCPDCGSVTVWDLTSDEWWTLDESDYGPEGSMRPADWGTGGLLDLL